MIRKRLVGSAKPLKQEIHLNIKRGTARGVFSIAYFEDHGHQIAYLPALNLTSYGNNKHEAIQMLDEVVDDYLDGLFSLPEPQVVSELQKLGWKRDPIFNKDFTADAHIDREGILRNFNLPAETEIEQQLMSV
ncbi:hypothetical protein [Mucilaginibacter arboris]|uniref:Uncharacterized protein n=1 Tax=Mucilaginibacter arboris TaxID=2682090 RepID=A0A7K1SWE2_9SPHI|nr:hypothetical protein [Mucilaginibacter arboris]MVN21380.1 hypothetical protein [Mucilaginibacter arboris]